jgi:hypothetical protein
MSAQTVPHAAAPRADDVPHARWWHWIACYLLFVVLLFACYQGFWLCRASIQNVTDVLLNRDMWRPTVYMAATALTGLAFFAIAMAGEGYLRGALTAPLLAGHFATRLAGRFMKLMLLIALFIGTGIAIQEALFRLVAR